MGSKEFRCTGGGRMTPAVDQIVDHFWHGYWYAIDRPPLRRCHVRVINWWLRVSGRLSSVLHGRCGPDSRSPTDFSTRLAQWGCRAGCLVHRAGKNSINLYPRRAPRGGLGGIKIVSLQRGLPVMVQIDGYRPPVSRGSRTQVGQRLSLELDGLRSIEFIDGGSHWSR